MAGEAFDEEYVDDNLDFLRLAAEAAMAAIFKAGENELTWSFGGDKGADEDDVALLFDDFVFSIA